ncbi:MAG TPA: hemerythrin domain-containing protein [Terriglobales bacterium]|jgi:hemerythrin-like domain-containing protein
MLRDKNLVPLSHQHQHALALCVRLDRALLANDVNLQAWQAEIQQLFEQEVALHFAAEEEHVFPVASRFSELGTLVLELRSEHRVLRDLFVRAVKRQLDAAGLRSLVEVLASHIRKEERQLFESLQKLMDLVELSALGSKLQEALAGADKSCLLASEATRLRPAGK